MDINIINLFTEANILIKISISILIIFSIISWSIIIYRYCTFNAAYKTLEIFKKKFWSGIELSKLYQETITHRNTFNAIEHIFYVGFKEFYKLCQIKDCAPKMIISRTHRIMYHTMNIELEKLENYVSLMGTIGSTSPYIGLFGTVLGIIHVFIELGKITNAANNITINNQVIHMHVIAPGISEALISTAIGLFVAIPAVIAFNYFNVQINNFNHYYNNFIEEFISILYHQVFFNIRNPVIHKDNQHEKTTCHSTSN